MMVLLVLGVGACGGDGSSEPIVTYDGAGCTYDGPDEFQLNSEVTIEFVQIVDEPVGLAVWEVPESMTAETIRDRGMINHGTLFEDSGFEPTESGLLLEYTFDRPGFFALNCAARPEDGPAVDYANFFIVSE
jgi:hypothetical protein